jgi:uncharacterized protein (DUF1501 family)
MPACGGRLSRRAWLRIGTLGLGGLTLADALATRAAAAGAAQVAREKAVVVLFLAGGASHIETFDPKPDAPESIRSVTGNVRTAIPGVSFGATFPLLAERAGKLAVVRSFGHRVNDHAKAIQHVLTAAGPAGASMGSLYARLRGPENPETALPTYGLVTSDEVDPQYQKELLRVRESSGPGPFGRSYGPFDPAQNDDALDSMRLTVPAERLEDRRTLLRALDDAKRQIDASHALDAMGRFQQKAFDLILRSAGEALELDREDPRLVDRYDTGSFQVGHKRKRPCTLGRQLLMARKLVEAGCGFVTVENAGWDMHADVNNPGIKGGMEMLGPPLDRAVSAFLDDVAARGLSERVLLVITGDFGRTPKVNARGGRDHWAPLSTLAFAGGGLAMGQVIGQSTRSADHPASDPITPGDVFVTLLHVLFDVPALRALAGVPREITQALDAGQPIHGLL